MNCSESRRLQRLLSRLWQELRGGGAPGTVPNASSSSSSSRPDGAPSSALRTPAAAAWPGGAGDAYLYILLIMIFYGCLAGGLILAYTRSRKLESKHDPYHLYIERDWTAAAAGGGGRAAAAEAAAREPSQDEGRSSGDSEEHP